MFLSLAPVYAQNECAFQAEPVIIQSAENKVLQYWVEQDRAVFKESMLPSSKSLHEFRDSITQKLDTNPFAILKNQLNEVSGGDSINVRRAMEQTAGEIREINCLEGLLLSVQTDRSEKKKASMYSNPTEFSSYVLQKKDLLKIYFYTVDQPGIGGMGIFNELLKSDREDGWKVVSNLHNHNFFPGSEIVLGGTVPGVGDVQYLRNAAQQFGFATSSITNGFHTIDMTKADLRMFSSGGL